MSASLTTLPTDVIQRLIDIIIETGARPGHLFQLSLVSVHVFILCNYGVGTYVGRHHFYCVCYCKVCKDLKAAVEASDFWERQCRQTGFSNTQAIWQYVRPPEGGWYNYYSKRMQDRYTIRQDAQKLGCSPRMAAWQALMGLRPSSSPGAS